MEGSPPSYSAVSPYLGQYVTPRLLALQSQANLTGIPWSWLMASQKYFYFLSSAEHNYAESFQVNSKNHCRIIDLLTCHQQLWKVFSLLFIYSSVSATDNWPDCPSLSVNCPLILTTDRIILVKRVAVQGTTWRAIITKQFHYAAVSHQWRLTNCLGSCQLKGSRRINYFSWFISLLSVISGMQDWSSPGPVPHCLLDTNQYTTEESSTAPLPPDFLTLCCEDHYNYTIKIYAFVQLSTSILIICTKIQNHHKNIVKLFSLRWGDKLFSPFEMKKL